MKKLFFGTCAALVMSMTSCCGNGTCNADGNDSIVSKATSDSLSETFGKLSGAQALDDVNRYVDMDNFSKEKAMQAIQLVLSADKSQSSFIGMSIGLGIINQIEQLKRQGIEIDRNLLMNKFKKSFMNDSVDMNDMNEAFATYQRIMQQVQDAAIERERARREKTPEAIQNVKTGEAYVNKIKASDPEVKTTASGLSYKIIEKGDTTKIGPNTIVAINYTGKFTDGKVFETTEGREPARLSPSGVSKGFREGLMMLGKGGKATLYVPGKLGYGVDGCPDANIGPNQMLVFDIEIVDVNPSAK